jgi:hypothetical protein
MDHEDRMVESGRTSRCVEIISDESEASSSADIVWSSSDDDC